LVWIGYSGEIFTEIVIVSLYRTIILPRSMSKLIVKTNLRRSALDMLLRYPTDQNPTDIQETRTNKTKSLRAEESDRLRALPLHDISFPLFN
jgi:hypothetical protein